MPLKSREFSGDPRLEACAVSDPAHVTPGSVGDFVGKIRQARISPCQEANGHASYDGNAFCYQLAQRTAAEVAASIHLQYDWTGTQARHAFRQLERPAPQLAPRPATSSRRGNSPIRR